MSKLTREQRKDGLCYQYSQAEINEINACVEAGFTLEEAINHMRKNRPKLDGHFLNSEGEVIK